MTALASKGESGSERALSAGILGPDALPPPTPHTRRKDAPMPVTDRDRHALYVAARERLGEHEADTLMALLPTDGWADVARRSDLDTLEVRLTARIEGVEARLAARIDGLEVRIDGLAGRIDGLAARIDGVEARLDGRIDACRSELMAYIDTRLSSLLWKQLAMMVALVALVFTIVAAG
jgi:hypothetical protein